MQSVTTAMQRVMLPVTSQLASRTSHHGALRTHLARQAYSPGSSDESSTAPDEASAWSAETMGERSVFTRWASAFACIQGRGRTKTPAADFDRERLSIARASVDSPACDFAPKASLRCASLA